MKLFNAILSKVRSLTDCNQKSDKKYASPPPENSETILIPRRRKKRVYKYAYVVSRVDSSPPRLDVITPYNKLQYWQSNFKRICIENQFLVANIRKAQLSGGKVDCHWSSEPQSSLRYYRNRVDFLKRINRDNQELYKRIVTAIPRVEPTESLRQAWKRNKQEMIIRAENAFVLFPPVDLEIMEDGAFAAPPGVKRPRVYITVGFLGSAIIGELCFELFTDVCPKTCRLFTELLDGDTLGYGYVGTSFFRKVPHLYWSGGDVTHDNGFGCYAQRGLSQPIGAENYHFSHSMPGLLSMRVTRDDEVCGIFNITFKALPQFDLHNIVFGRVIRPSTTYNTAQVLGQPLSSYPVIKIVATRRRRDGKWVTGEPNTRLVPPQYKARLANSRKR